MGAPKCAHEVTLIGEADCYSDLAGRLAATQQRPGTREAQMGLVLMRSSPKLRPNTRKSWNGP